MLASATLIIFSALAATDAPIRDLAAATTVFLDGLDADQRALAQFEFDAEERWTWHYVPMDRAGLSFAGLREEQHPLLLDVLRAGLSEGGYKTAETIRSLEVLLREIEGPAATHRDPLDYHLSVFGTPDADGTWGLRYEGHHLSLHWTIVKGMAIATTPQFLGANPGEVRGGDQDGLRVLGTLEDLGRTFLKSLDAEQQKSAIVSDEAPRDILIGRDRDATPLDDVGIAYDRLTGTQQEQFLGLIEAYAHIQHPEVAAQRLSRIRNSGLHNLKFAWLGGTERGEPHYYRIQGKTFIVEYDNVQKGANHPHTVWRDFHGDFGKDLLKEHYARHKH